MVLAHVLLRHQAAMKGRYVNTNVPHWYERLRIRVPLDCSENFSSSTIKALVDRNVGLSIDSDHPARARL